MVNRFSLRLLGIIYILFLTVFLLFPFDFMYPVSAVKTDARWLSERGGIEIPSKGIISSITHPQRLYDMLLKGEGLTIEIWLMPGNIWQHGPARIVSYSYNKYLRNFTIGQERNDLVLRLRTTETNLNGVPPIVVSNVFVKGRVQHLVITYDFLEERVYTNGKERLKTENIKGNFSNWDPSYHLVLANEFTGNRQWRGRLFLVAIYNRALSASEILQNYQAGISFPSETIAMKRRVRDGLVTLYLFNEKEGKIVKDRSGLYPPLDLKIPEKFKVTNKVFLRHPFQNYTINYETMKDLALNIGFFIPLGFLYTMLIRRRGISSFASALTVVIGGILFSLTIESLQYFIESRSSSLTDVVNDATGVILGVIFACLYLLRCPRNYQ